MDKELCGYGKICYANIIKLNLKIELKPLFAATQELLNTVERDNVFMETFFIMEWDFPLLCDLT